MRYLYGDSTESALERNYLAFLRDAIDFCVVALQSDAGLAAGRERRAARERAAAESTLAVEAFGRRAVELAEPVTKTAGDAALARAAASVVSAANEAVRRETAQIKTALAADLELIDGEARRLRAACVAALGHLLHGHDLPDAVPAITVRWSGGAYQAQLRQKAKFGLEVALELDIPGSSIFANDVRIDRVADGIELHAPEQAGWLKKELKMVPHKLARYHVTEVVVGGDGVMIGVRATPEPGAAGFTITVSDKGDVTVERAGGEDTPPFATDDRDVSGLRGLAEKLEAAARALAEHRGAVAGATLEGVALADHDHPRVVVERLVAAMAPVVREIAAHSLAPGELVLKRLLAGDRREEIFVPRSELVHKLDVLPPEGRRVFAPLGLADEAPAHAHPHDGDRGERPARRTMPPPPPPPPRISSQQSAVAVDAALRDLDTAERASSESDG